MVQNKSVFESMPASLKNMAYGWDANLQLNVEEKKGLSIKFAVALPQVKSEMSI